MDYLHVILSFNSDEVPEVQKRISFIYMKKKILVSNETVLIWDLEEFKFQRAYIWGPSLFVEIVLQLLPLVLLLSGIHLKTTLL